jgi:kynurenine formamidase
MKLIEVTVPLDSALPPYPDMIVIEALNLADVDPGVYEMYCLPLRIVGADGAPARVVLRKS